MLISVIVAVRDGERFLAEALESVLAQGRHSLEIVVVDGGSTDRSAAIARSYPAVRLIRQEGRGLASARNQGVQAARGDLLGFLDADDLWEPGKLDAQTAHLAAHPGCDAVLGHMVRFVQPGCRAPAQYSDGWLDRPAPAYTPGGLLVRRAAFARVGPFDPSLSVGCDSDWFARARDVGLSLDLLPQTVLRKRIHEGNLSRDLASYRREVLALTRESLVRRKVMTHGSRCEA